MAASPKISVITACYNHGKYIHEMIDSVMNQTFRDFEMIIVNDGSTDESKQILNSVRNEKILVIHTENKGPSAARNTAINEAKAGIIFNLDADDMIAPDFLEKAYKVFLKNANAGIVYTRCRFFGHRSGEMHLSDYSLKSMLKSNKIVSAACFRKEDWRIVEGYSEAFVYGLEDWDLWLSIIELGREVVKIPDSYVYYRKYKSLYESRSGQRKIERKKAIKSLTLIFDRHKSLYSDVPSVERKFSGIKWRFENEGIYFGKLRDKVFHLKQKVFRLYN